MKLQTPPLIPANEWEDEGVAMGSGEIQWTPRTLVVLVTLSWVVIVAGGLAWWRCV